MCEYLPAPRGTLDGVAGLGGDFIPNDGADPRTRHRNGSLSSTRGVEEILPRSAPADAATTRREINALPAPLGGRDCFLTEPRCRLGIDATGTASCLRPLASERDDSPRLKLRSLG